MYAVVANGIQAVCSTQRQLDTLIAIYPYPKFAVVRNQEEGRDWIRKHARSFNNINHENYGDTANWGYCTLRYEIKENCVEYKIDSSRLGFIRIRDQENVISARMADGLTVIVKNLSLENDLIAHHIIAVQRILKILGEFVDVNIVVPDISIFLAMTKYNGSNYIIKGYQHMIATRLGGIAITVEDEEDLSSE